MGNYLGRDFNQLSLSGAATNIGGGAATGATVGSIFPGPGTAIGAGVGATFGILKTVFGGSREEGYGLTKPDTLPHAIDKLEKANDNEAMEIAKEAVILKLKGATDLVVSNHILQRLGYPVDGSLISSNKWPYIKRTLDKAVRQVRAQQEKKAYTPPQNTTVENGTDNGNSSIIPAGSNNANNSLPKMNAVSVQNQKYKQAGISTAAKYLFFTVGLSTAGYAGWKYYKSNIK